ncbi:hypothetical protein CRE_01086 [Caenorhabditis remanei]|uniref:Uncharacterized protein n=1 Tax=Caenorhabditis remanei TaxID=31234 RepID=E3MID5_CAERE|nr:hypothetical protein CRE_01086 [Caenorhabditis remanei]
MSNLKSEKKLENGVFVNSYFGGDLVFLTAQNSAKGYAYLQPIVKAFVLCSIGSQSGRTRISCRSNQRNSVFS